jgi:hypothetical protein
MALLLLFHGAIPQVNIGSRGELPRAVLKGWRCGRWKFCFHKPSIWVQ